MYKSCKSYKECLQYEEEKRDGGLLKILQTYFQDDSITETTRWDRYDYVTTNKTFELKNRTNAYKDFPTTILPKHKIRYTNDTQIFLFNFTDRLTYIEFDKDLFNKFSNELFVCNKRPDYNDKKQMYVYIPIEYLKTIVEY